MRPSVRLLRLTGLLLALTAVALATGLPPGVALFLWALLAGAALADLAVSPGRGAVSLDLAGPADVFSGEFADFRARLTAPRGRLPRAIEARLEIDDALGRQLPFRLTGDGALAEGVARLPARVRGVFRIPALWLSWPSRFGLWDVTARFAQDLALRIVPNIRPVASGKIDVTVRSELYGVKDTATRGEGSEFHQLTDFVTGMDTRTIDWKHSARTRSLVAKEMRAERNHQIILALDNGYLMRAEIAGLPKIDHAINAALATAWAAGLGGDLVGLYSYDAEPRLYVPPQPARAAFPALRAHTAAMAYATTESNPTLAMAHLNARLKRRSLIVVFSDFVDTTTAELLIENLAVLSRTHVMIFVTLRDPSLDAVARNRSADLDGVASAVVAGDMLRDRQIVLDRLARMGILTLDVAPDQLTARLVSTYLMIKAREMI